MSKDKTALKYMTYSISYRNGSTSADIFHALCKYDSCFINSFLLLMNKQPDTIRRTLERMANEGTVEFLKGLNKQRTVHIKNVHDVPHHFRLSASRARTDVNSQERAARLAETAIMMEVSKPIHAKSKNRFEHIKHLSKTAQAKELSHTRMCGVYDHYEQAISVFNLGSSLYWNNILEENAKTYISRCMDMPIHTAIFFIPTLDMVVNIVKNPSQHNNLFNPDKCHCCYSQMVFVPVTKDGIEQLRIWRSYPDIQQYYRKMFLIDDSLCESDDIRDGIIDHTQIVLLFNFDVYTIRKLYVMFDTNRLARYTVYCFDFQEETLNKIFEGFTGVTIVAYPVDKVKACLRLA